MLHRLLLPLTVPTPALGCKGLAKGYHWHTLHRQLLPNSTQGRAALQASMSTTDAMDLLRKILLMRQQGSEENGRTGAAAARAAEMASPEAASDAAAPVRDSLPSIRRS